MASLDRIHEFAFVQAITKGFRRSPHQLHGIHEADAELLRLKDGVLAITIDGLEEEFRYGLLQDPECLGWAIVSHALSDLAAVGVPPLGVLLSYNLPEAEDPGWAGSLNAGAAAALEAHGTYCLGGDTSFSSQPSFQCVGLGYLESGDPIHRLGARAGDPLYGTGVFGLGNLLGLALVAKPELRAELEAEYRPRVDFASVRALRPFLRASIDSSDGLAMAVDLLARLNGLGVDLDAREEIFHPGYVTLAAELQAPYWIASAFGMGEYNLVWAVDQDREDEFLEAAKETPVHPLKLGILTAEPDFRLRYQGQSKVLDSAELLNLFAKTQDPKSYFQALLEFHAKTFGPEPAP